SSASSRATRSWSPSPDAPQASEENRGQTTISAVHGSGLPARKWWSDPGFPSGALDELDLVAVGILDEGDHAAAELHRPGLARHLPALRLHRLARLVRIGHGHRHVAEA